MSFWGIEVKADGKPAPYVPPPEAARLHLSQATLGLSAADGQKAAVSCKTQDGPEVFICTLKEGGQECCNLDLVFDHYTEFTVHGAASVHLAGYYMPEYEAEEEEDDDDEDGEDELAITGHPYAQHVRYGSNGDAYEFDSDDFDSEGSDDEDDEDEDDEDGAQPRGRRSDVVIEELHDEEEPEQTEDGALVKRQIGQTAPAAAAADGDKDMMAIEEGEAAARRAIEADVSAKDLPAAAKREAAELKGAPGSKRKGDKLQAAAAKKAAVGEDVPQAATGAQVVDEEAPVKAEEIKLSRKQKKKAAAQAKTSTAQGPREGSQSAAAQPKSAATAVAPVKAAEDDKDEDGEDEDDLEDEEDAQPGKAKKRTFPNGFEIIDLRAGQPDGKLAKPGKTVVVRYVGRLKNGKIFDQTKGQTTFKFRLGVGEVIKGWDRGVEGMRVGDKRRLTVPPQMGYGTSGVRGAIPPNSTLIFDVELVNVIK